MPSYRDSLEASDPHSQRLRHVCETDRTPPTERQIRNARRAYYGAVSYVDDQFASILEALEQAGLANDTTIVVTSDHGEMLGERGLWYKMTFFEGGCRVPLIVHAPKRFDAHRVSASVSHLDVLPTLVDLARGDAPSAWPDSLDGQSLVPHLAGADGHDEAIGEFLAEGAIAPIVMIRRERYKFIHTSVDPDQLYDVAADPLERNNLASDARHASQVTAFRDEIARRWDLEALHRDVLKSQRRRHFHFAATTQGAIQSWDWQPHVDASQRYMRNHIDLDTLEAMARFPAVER